MDGAQPLTAEESIKGPSSPGVCHDSSARLQSPSSTNSHSPAASRWPSGPAAVRGRRTLAARQLSFCKTKVSERSRKGGGSAVARQCPEHPRSEEKRGREEAHSVRQSRRTEHIINRTIAQSTHRSYIHTECYI